MIQEIEWTDHARDRLRQWHVGTAEIEAVIHAEHRFRSSNPGRADWQVMHSLEDGTRLKVLYKCPIDGDEARVRVVTVMRQGPFRRR
jgi:hypothetical protein